MGFLKNLSLGLSALAVTALAEEAAKDKEPETKFVSALTKDDFASTIAENKFVLVKWYEPGCGPCKAMAADYEEAGKD